MGFVAGLSVPPAAAVQSVVSANLLKYIVPDASLCYSADSPSGQNREPATQRNSARFLSVLGVFLFQKPGTTDLSMFRSGQGAVIHPVSQPLAFHGIAAGLGVPPAASIQPVVSALLEKKMFRTSQNILAQAWGRHSVLSCLPVFQRASLISATSGPSGLLPSNRYQTLSPSLVTPRHSSARLLRVLRLFQAGLGPQISA